MSEFSSPQSINQVSANNAEVHMAKLGSEIIGEHASAGWAQKASEKHPQSNEDSVYAVSLPNGSQLFGVFDGVGGHDAGDVASKTARQSLHESARKGTSTLRDMFGAMSEAVVPALPCTPSTDSEIGRAHV